MNQAKAELVPKGDVRLILFKGKGVRQIFHNDEWFFSAIDVISVLSSSDQPSKYWRDLKTKLVDTEGVAQLSAQIGQLKLPATDGKMRETDTLNTKTLLRIVQSVPSKNAEPFKQWLAEVGEERLQEINDPEMAVQRAIYHYKSKDHDDKWINKRMKTVLSRKDLTSEWQRRGIKDGLQYALLTDSISEGIFGLKTKKHKKVKALKSNHNLRDHMSPVELALTMQGETATMS